MQTSWPGGSRQMAAIVPSWQQLPPQHAAIQQPLLSDAGDWGRPLIVDSSAILQVDVTTLSNNYSRSRQLNRSNGFLTNLPCFGEGSAASVSCHGSIQY